jgi:Spy/CpxP family protein refolding chaperone
MLDERRRKTRSRLATATAKAKRKPLDPEAAAAVEELRQQYRAIAAEDYIKKLVDEAPRLTPEQRDRLALLLRGGAAA